MGQKVNPLGFRVGITEDWRSRWYAPKAAYGDFLGEDYKIRRRIDEKLNRRPPFAAVAEVNIERTREEVTITLRTARPGLVIGPKGAEVDKLREELEDLIKRKVAPIKVIEIKNPALNAQLVAESVAEQLKKRAAFRRVLKQRTEETMSSGAKGIKIVVGGRLGGAEIARSEKSVSGSVPLTTVLDTSRNSIMCRSVSPRGALSQSARGSSRRCPRRSGRRPRSGASRPAD